MATPLGSWSLPAASSLALSLVLSLAPALPVAAATAATGTHACRCPQVALERYFERAEIVLVGRAEAVQRVEAEGGAPRVEVRFTPQFRQGRAFKGSLEGVVFATPIGTAGCGVEVEVGESYVVFASRGDPDEPGRAWFDTCSGSRRYVGGAAAHETEPFIGLPVNRIVPRLFELADPSLAPQEPPGSDFHTSPACWSEPRIAHQGTPPGELRSLVRVGWTRDAVPDTGGVAGPNGAYRYWTAYVPEGEIGEAGGSVLVDVERGRTLGVSAAGARAAPQPSWINEKLLFVRLVWGRVQFTDLVVDVERGALVYEEAARWAVEAYEQYREACIGQCPCFVVPGRTAELVEPPAASPAGGDAGALDGLTAALAYLGAGWDGRVFTEPGGRAYTVSGLKGALGREEVPADVLEVREAAEGWWLRVELYAVSRCDDAHAVPVHAGWVPAFSDEGAPVADTWPGGC